MTDATFTTINAIRALPSQWVIDRELHVVQGERERESFFLAFFFSSVIVVPFLIRTMMDSFGFTRFFFTPSKHEY